MQDQHTKQYDERAMVLLLLIETLLTSISVWHANCIFYAYSNRGQMFNGPLFVFA